MKPEQLVRRYKAGKRDFGKVNLSGANLREVDLVGADLSEARLDWTDLRKANLHKADLSGADLRRAKLQGANLIGADLCRADLSGANLTGAKVAMTQLTQAKMSGRTIMPDGRERRAEMSPERVERTKQRHAEEMKRRHAERMRKREEGRARLQADKQKRELEREREEERSKAEHTEKPEGGWGASKAMPELDQMDAGRRWLEANPQIYTGRSYRGLLFEPDEESPAVSKPRSPLSGADETDADDVAPSSSDASKG